MQRMRYFIIFSLLAFLLSISTVFAQSGDAKQDLVFDGDYPGVLTTITQPNPQFNVVGNTNFYEAFVDNTDQIGRYTIRTGTNHPVPGENLFFGGQSGVPLTSYTTIRSFSTNTDYVMGNGVGNEVKQSSNTVVYLNDYVDSVTVIAGGRGIRTRYILPGGGTTPDQLDIIIDIIVKGTVYTNSYVEITTSITKLDFTGFFGYFGIRHLWDFQIAQDDGPTFLQVNPNGSVTNNEFEAIAPAFESFRLQDNDINPTSPTFEINGSVTGPAGLEPSPDAPTLLRFGCWGDTYPQAFDYTVNTGRDIASEAGATDCRNFAGGDGSILTYFGHTFGTAIVLGTDETARRTSHVYLTVPSAPVTTDTDGDGLLDVWETNGFDFNGDGVADVDLPALGADPNKKDVLVYYDWVDGQQPSAASLQAMIDSFANAPVSNPDLTTGINMIITSGSQIPLTAATQEIGTIDGSCIYDWTEFANLKAQYFPPEMWPIYHYMISAPQMPIAPCVGGRPIGISRGLEASDFLSALGDQRINFDATTMELLDTMNIMHELGHNLGLGHGGRSGGSPINTNYKPNHLSIMSYNYSNFGLITFDGANWAQGSADYSGFDSTDLPTINETNVDETTAFGGADPALVNYGAFYYCIGTNTQNFQLGLQNANVDWNCDGDTLDDNQSGDLNRDGGTGTLTTNNEWDQLVFDGGLIGDYNLAFTLPVRIDSTGFIGKSSEQVLEDAPDSAFRNGRRNNGNANGNSEGNRNDGDNRNPNSVPDGSPSNNNANPYETNNGNGRGR